MKRKGELKVNSERTRFGKWYDKWLNKWIPSYGVLSLISCFLLNCLIYWGTQLIVAGAHHYDLTSTFDRKVPFIKEWVYIYLICFLFWAMNYILMVREGRKEWFQFATADMMSRLFCGIIFIVLPTTNVRPNIVGNDLSSWLMRFVYWIDSPTNLFPSIHCLVSWFCFIGIRKSKKIPSWYKIFSLVFAILVCMSTQFTKQHYIVDVIAGIVIAELCYFISCHCCIYKKLEYFFDKIGKRVFGGA